ncbi:MAG: DUF2474 domain-containing protein [Hyphomicrobiaceae bacterium]
MTPGNERHVPLWRRLAWFVALWIAGVAVTAAAAMLIRAALLP